MHPSTMVQITNTGAVTGDEVVQARTFMGYFLDNAKVSSLPSPPAQVYMVPSSMPLQPASRLLKKLVAYERVHLGPGDATQLTFPVSSATFAIVDKTSGAIVSTPGAFSLSFTNGAGVDVASGPIAVKGSQVVTTPFPS